MILKEEILVKYEDISIHDLKYLKENPRVLSSVSSIGSHLTEDEVQNEIHSIMKKQPSVLNVKKRISAHGGLTDPILVRIDSKAVIEGNSRLTAFRMLHEETKEDKWALIPCHVVTGLTDDQQFSYLNEIHVKGKTPWTAYEKANMAYNASINGKTDKQIATWSGETTQEIAKRIRTIKMMHENKDKEQKRFSYYNVLVRNRAISTSINGNPKLKSLLLDEIKGEKFDALELRDKFPTVLAKKKVLNKYMNDEWTLNQAYEAAKPSDVSKRVRDATVKIGSINKSEVQELNNTDFNIFVLDVKNFNKKVTRLIGMVKAQKKQV